MVVIDGKVQTAGILILAKVDGQLAVALTREKGREVGRWVFPKGKVEAGETLVAAAHREITEEIGELKYALLTKLGVVERLSTENSGEVVAKQIHMFLGWCDNPGLLVPSAPDIAEAAWIPLATAIESLPYQEDRAAFFEWFSPAFSV